VEFWSPRVGMKRLTEKSGYQLEMSIYKKGI